jgi:hypothetical protein
VLTCACVADKTTSREDVDVVDNNRLVSGLVLHRLAWHKRRAIQDGKQQSEQRATGQTKAGAKQQRSRGGEAVMERTQGGGRWSGQ